MNRRMKGEVITREAKKRKGWLAGKQPHLETQDYGPQQTSSTASLPAGPKHSIEKEPVPAQPNLNC